MSSALLINPTAMEAGLMAAADAVSGEASSKARQLLADIGLPHRRMEQWRWSDFRNSLREPIPFAKGDGGGARLQSSFEALNPFVITVAADNAYWQGEPPAGVSLSFLENAPIADDLHKHPMALAAAAVSNAGLAIHIAAEQTVDRPILIQYSVTGAQKHARVFPWVQEKADVTILECFEADEASWLNTTLEAKVERGGVLRRAFVQRLADDAAISSTAAAVLAEDARFEQTGLLFGGKLIRIETVLHYVGENASSDLNSASLLKGARHADVTSLICHSAPTCETRQSHKSVVSDRARGVFQGKFLVAREGQKTDADMQANALLLSDTAEANHKPELEIYADDVECAHGSTAGSIDEEALFYMRQRGLNDAAARSLLIEAFVNEAIEAVASDDVQNVLKEYIAQWLNEAQL